MRTYYVRHKSGFESTYTATDVHAAYQGIKSMLRDNDLSPESEDWEFTRIDDLLDI